jgi:hypothetical protein
MWTFFRIDRALQQLNYRLDDFGSVNGFHFKIPSQYNKIFYCYELFFTRKLFVAYFMA